MSSLPARGASADSVDHFDVHSEVYDRLAHPTSNGSCAAAELKTVPS